jgi:hypothetical protein
MHAGLSVVDVRRGSAWLPLLVPSLFVSDDLPVPMLYLVTGNAELDGGLIAALPVPPDRRATPPILKGKDISGGQLSWTGYNKHLVPPSVCEMFPTSERTFVWYDRTAGKLRRAPERADFGCYPTPSEHHRFSLYTGSSSQLMLALTPAGGLMLALAELRSAFEAVDRVETVLVREQARHYVVSRAVRTRVLGALEGHGAVGVLARAAMAGMLILREDDGGGESGGGDASGDVTDGDGGAESDGGDTAGGEIGLYFRFPSVGGERDCGDKKRTPCNWL